MHKPSAIIGGRGKKVFEQAFSFTELPLLQQDPDQPEKSPIDFRVSFPELAPVCGRDAIVAPGHGNFGEPETDRRIVGELSFCSAQQRHPGRAGTGISERYTLFNKSPDVRGVPLSIFPPALNSLGPVGCLAALLAPCRKGLTGDRLPREVLVASGKQLDLAVPGRLRPLIAAAGGHLRDVARDFPAY